MKTFQEYFGARLKDADPATPEISALAGAFIDRLRLEGMEMWDIEARIARWEVLEEAAIEEQVKEYCKLPDPVLGTQEQYNAARAAILAGNRCGKGAAALPCGCTPGLVCRVCGPQYFPTTAQALQPTISAELGRANTNHPGFDKALRESLGVAVECGCGGPAGHVPNGVLCRKGMR